MAPTTDKAGQVGRKKRSIPARVVKLDADLVGRGEMLARDQGIPTADYLSKLLRPIIDREWSKLVRKASEGGK